MSEQKIEDEKSLDVKYRSLWPKFILRSKVVIHLLIFQKYVIHPSNTI